MIQVKNIGILFVTIAITWLTLLSPKSLQAVENTTYIYPPWKHTWGVRRATSFKLRLFLGNKTTFQDPQGIACTILKTWDDPDKTSDDDELTAYGVNSGANCIIYNSSMFSLAIYGLEDGHEKMNRPWGIAADPDGNVYVVDRGNSRVLHLFNPESALEYVKTIGGPGSEDGSFIDPNGVALDSNGNIYVTDSALGRVSVFNKNGDLIDVWDGFIDPGGIAVIGPKTRNFYRDARFAIVIDS
ncbi:NHL repeat-containing protein, partial [bacterium]|nr:NHL repeat-containing protein [bacterium]